MLDILGLSNLIIFLAREKSEAVKKNPKSKQRTKQTNVENKKPTCISNVLALTCEAVRLRISQLVTYCLVIPSAGFNVLVSSA